MQIRSLITGAILLIIVGISSCRDDFDFEPASDELSFSTDTLSLDTIFNHTNSQTYKLTVHNRQDEDVEIPRIFLSRGESSFYKLNVDGMPGYAFENVAVRAKDSIFIFVEVAAGDAPVNPFYEDEVNFETTNGSQQVKLISWIERALFYNTEMQENYPLGNVNWDSEYSRVIYGNVTADNFSASAGTKVYFHNNSSLTVNGTMTVTGEKGNEVRFRSDRHDERSDSLPNMWNKIHLKPGANASINYAIIKGGDTGLELENANSVEIINTKILNNDTFGINSKNTQSLIGKNLVINNSSEAAVKIEGGNSEFVHCTIGNYHNIGDNAGNVYSLWLTGAVNAKFYNSIFYGRASQAVYIEEGTTSGYDFRNNVINGPLPNNGNGFTNTISEDPMFVDPGFGKNDLRLSAVEDSTIPGHADADWIIEYGLQLDINGIERTGPVLPGAYQERVALD